MDDETRSGRLRRISVAAFEEGNLLKSWQVRRLDTARQLYGCGEDPLIGNNQGQWVDFLRENDGVMSRHLGQSRTGGSGSWCATGVSAIDTLTAIAMGIRCPHTRYRGARMLADSTVRSGGAKYVARCVGPWPFRVIEWFAISGEKSKEIQQIPEGSWISWWRGGRDSRMGHIEIVSHHDLHTGNLTTITFNRDNRPRKDESPPQGAKVSRWAVIDEHTYRHNAWLRHLYAVTSYYR